MTGIHVNVTDLGAAAEAGAVRYNLTSGSVMIVHNGLPLDEQAALVTELTRPGEVPVYINLPTPRPAPDDQILGRRSAAAAHLRVAAGVASAIVASGCAGPLAGG